MARVEYPLCEASGNSGQRSLAGHCPFIRIEELTLHVFPVQHRVVWVCHVAKPLLHGKRMILHIQAGTAPALAALSHHGF